MAALAMDTAKLAIANVERILLLKLIFRRSLDDGECSGYGLLLSRGLCGYL